LLQLLSLSNSVQDTSGNFSSSLHTWGDNNDREDVWNDIRQNFSVTVVIRKGTTGCFYNSFAEDVTSLCI
jgi:hypothetical protein